MIVELAAHAPSVVSAFSGPSLTPAVDAHASSFVTGVPDTSVSRKSRP
jgi:hypothetical protein